LRKTFVKTGFYPVRLISVQLVMITKLASQRG